MDAVRYWIALMLVISIPPGLGLWLVIHPLVRFWRRVGPVCAYTAITLLLIAGAAGLFGVRRTLLATEFGTRGPLVVAGILCLVLALYLRVTVQRHFKLRTLVGLPELAPDRYPSKLVTEGIYARIRHPRYVQFTIALLGYALIANYLALYVVLALWIPVMYVIVRLEERELRDRFGREHAEYCRRVPRFVPRLG